MVLTVDKGVAMVVLDKEDYIQKAGNPLEQAAYKTIYRDPTNSIKGKLIQILIRLQREMDMDEGRYKPMYPTIALPSFIGYQKSIKLMPPSGLLYLAGLQSHMVWPKSLLMYLNH